MANTNITPNMNLPNPVPGVDSGPDYANNLQSSLNIIDQHNHSTGSGVPINPGGINVNADLPFNNNNATLLRSVRFYVQPADLASASPDQGCLYVVGNEVYYNDFANNQVQLTSNGSVNAGPGSITGLPSGTASATFNAGTFVFQSATNTSAVLDAGSVILRNDIPSSNGLTLSPPNLLSSNYALYLPVIPSAISILTLDTSGNIAASYTVDNSTIDINGSKQIEVKAGGITGSQVATNINLPGKAVQENGKNVVVSNTNATNSLAIIRGVVNTTTSTPVSGEGFSVTVNGTGDVTINFTTAFGDVPAVTTSAYGGTGPNTAQTVTGPTSSSVRIWTFNGASHADNLFSFIAIGQRA